MNGMALISVVSNKLVNAELAKSQNCLAFACPNIIITRASIDE
jgi:hypothetical protein